MKTPAQTLAAKKMNHRKPNPSTAGAPIRNAPWKCYVREVRLSLRLSLKDVAEAVSLSITALHQIEHGTDPMLTNARKLADFFGRGIEQLWPAPVAKTEQVADTNKEG